MNSVISNNLSLKYQRFTTLGSKDIRIIFRVFNKDSIPLSEFCEKFYENRKWKKGSCFTFFSLIVYIWVTVLYFEKRTKKGPNTRNNFEFLPAAAIYTVFEHIFITELLMQKWKNIILLVEGLDPSIMI